MQRITNTKYTTPFWPLTLEDIMTKLTQKQAEELAHLAIEVMDIDDLISFAEEIVTERYLNGTADYAEDYKLLHS